MPFEEGTKCHRKKCEHETSAKCRFSQKHLKFGIKQFNLGISEREKTTNVNEIILIEKSIAKWKCD